MGVTLAEVTGPPAARASSLTAPSWWGDSLLRRQPDREPQGRWIDCRNPLTWPDTLLPAGSELWMLRLLNLASLVLTQAVHTTSTRHLLGGLATAGLLVFTEFWIRIDITPMWRRYAIFAVNTALLGLGIAAIPIAGVASWAGYMLYASLFTGAPMTGCIAISCVLMTATQFDGWSKLTAPVWAGVLGWSVNVLIGLTVVAIIGAREASLRRRQELTDDLLAERARNAELHHELLRQARHSGVRDERARLARELHDTVAQGFVAVVTQLESIDEKALPPPVRERLDNAKSLARDGLAEARHAVNALAPIGSDGRTLPSLLRDQLATFSRLHPITTELRVDGTARSVEADGALLRIAQEALTNVAKHSQADNVVVTVTYLDDTAILDIRDDGHGFNPEWVRRDSTGGFGLTTMRERAELIGATVAIESEPGAGCVISISAPIVVRPVAVIP